MTKKHSHTQRQWEGKFFQCGAACFYCEAPLTLKAATKDHLVPSSRGGSNSIENIVPACWPCNRQKNNMTAEEYFNSRKVFSTRQQKFTAIGISLDGSFSGTTSSTGKNSPNSTPPQPINFALLDDSRLLEQLRRESESTSYAWRNPA